jgi:hypothetical protein
MAPEPGLEPGTWRLTAARSTIELLGNGPHYTTGARGQAVNSRPLYRLSYSGMAGQSGSQTTYYNIESLVRQCSLF